MSFNINFNGQCQEAFEYYSENLGGKIGTMLMFKDSPASSSVPEDQQNNIVHANISIDGVEVAGTDIGPDLYEKPKGFYVLLGVDSEEKARSIFASLE
jgi:PhnB protein